MGPKDWCPYEEGKPGHRQAEKRWPPADRHRGKLEAENAAMPSRTKAPEAARSWERQHGLSPGAREGACSCPHADGGLLAAGR